MSTVKDVTEHAVAVTLAAFGLVGTPNAVSVSLAALATIGFQSFRSSRGACEAAVTAVARQMTRTENPETLREVDRLLRDTGRSIDVAPGHMPDPSDAKTLDSALVDRILILVPAEASPDARALLRILFQHAVTATRYTPELHRAVTQDLLWQVFTDVRALRASLESLATASRDQLEALASRFRIPDPYALTDTQLRAELDDRAQEYRHLRKQVDALDERTAGLGNLKIAAQDALDRLDFEEAAELFAHIRTTQQELASETANAEADTLLLLDRVEEARDVLLDAADAYRRRDRETWLRLMYEAGGRLYEHGLKRSGPAMRFAADILGGLADALNTTTEAENWAGIQNNLGGALRILGERGDDAFLQDAITAFRDALVVYTRDALPVYWATTQNNLGNALQLLGQHGDDTALQGAVSAYHAALEVYTRDALPLDWAMTQNNLGNALAILGKRGDDASLQDAIAAFRAALEIHTRDALPVDWAGTRTNMALCFEAMAAAHPTDAAQHLADALASVEDALSIYTTEHMPFYFKRATALRDRILAAIATL